ncbi:MAG: FAD-dependent monooxygenase [Pseudomonadota bacterium]|uniref:FAD-dependent monooxygenase n=1 Tax=Burkholderiaceae TaxID=119060 RepID=UPI001BB102D9|nr:FAD-dependent monooxygenase [Burkholderia sp. 4M9327F10]
MIGEILCSRRKDFKSRSVLISGASIAGPALAYWLDRYGFDVTVVERSDTIRSGGYPIDVRGTAIDVVERMGVLSQLRAAHIDTRKLTFVDAVGKSIATLKPENLAGGVTTRHIELPRGELTSVLYDLTRDGRVRYRFNDSIEALHDDGAGVDVRFRSGVAQRFDIVIGADGMHSNTRALAFGPEAPFNRYLGFCFNLFSLPNELGLSHEAVVYGEPGRVAGVYAVGDSQTLHGFLNFAADEPPFHARPDVDRQRQRTVEIFSEGGWEVPRLIAAMQRADDLFFDTVSQIHMPCWSSGRVALAGDAAHAPSFLSGQGSSLALVGAYVLAGELAAHADPVEAFASYERIARPFMEANQGLATRKGGTLLMPRTQEEVDARNAALAAMQRSGEGPSYGDHARQVHNALTLPDYTGWLREQHRG